MLCRTGLSCLNLLTIPNENIIKIDCPFRNGKVCIGIFVNLNRSDNKHWLRKAL